MFVEEARSFGSDPVLSTYVMVFANEISWRDLGFVCWQKMDHKTMQVYNKIDQSQAPLGLVDHWVSVL